MLGNAVISNMVTQEVCETYLFSNLVFSLHGLWSFAFGLGFHIVVMRLLQNWQSGVLAFSAPFIQMPTFFSRTLLLASSGRSLRNSFIFLSPPAYNLCNTKGYLLSR